MNTQKKFLTLSIYIYLCIKVHTSNKEKRAKRKIKRVYVSFAFRSIFLCIQNINHSSVYL